MNSLNTSAILDEFDKIPRTEEDPEGNVQEEESPIKFFTPTAEFTYNEKEYFMTSSFGGRIMFETISRRITSDSIFLGTIDGVYGNHFDSDIIPEDFQYTIYRKNCREQISPDSPDFGIMRYAMETYINTEVRPSNDEWWDTVINVTKGNILRVLYQLPAST